MKIIVYDFEVFRHDTLLGCLILDSDQQDVIWQSWDKEEMKQFYRDHESDIWIAHNCLTYDNAIYEAILNDHRNVYAVSKDVIKSAFRKHHYLTPMTYDVMGLRFYSLKMSELSCGKQIHTTDVDFDLNRPLTEEEKRKTEQYNLDDLLQTKFNFVDTIPQFITRLGLINEFGLSKYAINYTEARIASTVLKCENIPDIENMYVAPFVPEQLQVKNQEVMNFYLTEQFRKGKNLKIMLCGCEHKLGAGGLHAALEKVHLDKIMYFDVSGYYNLIMINYDLLPRTMPIEGKELYEHLYHEQLRLKKIDPRKRSVYKVILLAVFGAMMNKYTGLYDPQRGSLVTILGQLFLIDLLEKLEESGLGYVVQSNTDGIMFEPYDWANEEAIWNIVREWENRTGFVIKKEVKYNLYQRDVNNYVFSTEQEIKQFANGSVADREEYVVARGEAVGNYWAPIEQSTSARLWESKDAIVICHGIVDYLEYGILPETTVENFKHDLRYFQYACKPLSYDYLVYEYVEDGQTKRMNVQSISRAFALKQDVGTGIVYKVKELDDGKTKQSKIACSPENEIIYNDEILSDEAKEALSDVIDWQWYIDRIYERITEFIRWPKIKEIL